MDYITPNREKSILSLSRNKNIIMCFTDNWQTFFYAVWPHLSAILGEVHKGRGFHVPKLLYFPGGHQFPMGCKTVNGAPLLCRKAGSIGVVHPGEEKDLERPHRLLPVPDGVL